MTSFLGVSREIGQPQRLGLDDEQPEDAVAFWEVADACRIVGIDAHRDELGEDAVLLVEDADRCISCTDQVGSGLGDAPEDDRQAVLGGDDHYCVQQPPELFHAGVLVARHEHRC